ncbi:MAG TPA: hypothetical protein VGZ29_10650 [Terriglobia bacterium]|nr:hypothetical protein [Terriglobia bacterium]
MQAKVRKVSALLMAVLMAAMSLMLLTGTAAIHRTAFNLCVLGGLASALVLARRVFSDAPSWGKWVFAGTTVVTAAVLAMVWFLAK